MALDGRARAELTEQIRAHTRARPTRAPASRACWPRFRRIHLDGRMRARVLDDLASGDLSIAELLHGRASFALFSELAEQLAPDAPFLDLFWHLRAMHVPLLRVLATPPRPPPAITRSPPATPGCARAVLSRRTGRPLMITEHGIYSRERDMELARAEWIEDRRPGAGDDAARIWAPQVVAAAAGLVALLPHAVAPGVPAGLAHRHAQRRQPAQAARRRRARREDRDRPERRRAPRRRRRERRPTRRRHADAGRRRRDSAAGAPAQAARRLRGTRRADQGRGHASSRRATWRCADVDSRRAHHRPRRRGPGLRARAAARWSRRLGPRGARSASSGPKPPSDDLRRPRSGRAHQLQRGPAAGDARGLRVRACRCWPPTSAPAAR